MGEKKYPGRLLFLLPLRCALVLHNMHFIILDLYSAKTLSLALGTHPVSLSDAAKDFVVISEFKMGWFSLHSKERRCLEKDGQSLEMNILTAEL